MALHVERHGTGPLVVWTHGFGSTGAVFTATAEALCDDHTVVTWDLPGHGRSVVPAEPDRFTVAAALGTLDRIRADSGADRAVFGGHSLGGYLSLAYALAHPERVSGLILVGTGPGFRDAAGRAAWNEMCEGFAHDLDQRGLDGLAGRRRPDELHLGDASGLALAARHLLPQHDASVIDGLGRIRVPALVVVGDRDRQFAASAAYLAAKLPGAGGEPVVIEDCGHTPPASHPDAFVAAVRAFLRRHEI